MQIETQIIRTDGGTQARAKFNQAHADDIKSAILKGEKIPEIVVFKDSEGRIWLGDGFHRLWAYISAGKEKINCEIKEGELRDAVLYSLSTNRTHGLKRTNADKRRSVMTMLEDDEWSKWTNSDIARACSVTQPYVSILRRQLAGEIVPSVERTKAEPGAIIIHAGTRYEISEVTGNGKIFKCVNDADIVLLRRVDFKVIQVAPTVKESLNTCDHNHKKKKHNIDEMARAIATGREIIEAFVQARTTPKALKAKGREWLEANPYAGTKKARG